ncbi:hypothetical protein F7725_009847 [Dissostichus mawsoni]|uniref:Uncharacterized protein n=1 Tax=Dissostichus mawsoni TaxID=36200 RepID=A0A7J5XNE0_DISMA|nr:hypothetical protein F7725_009847 [Dissostichus mawsoni]
MDESGQYGLCEQVCLLPIPPPSQICFCGPSQDFTIIPGKQTVLVTINGPYNVCLPSVCCTICSTKWSPATSSCKMIFKFDVFTSFEQMKLASPAYPSKIVAIPSTESFGSLPEDLCLVEPFKCPACTPDMLAIAVDGNRKHYRFKKSRGSDSKVSAFVDKIRSQMTIIVYFRKVVDVCGPATFTACRKSSAKVDEEGLQIAVCRHGILLQGLNHYRGIYAYPMFLQKELAEVVNATFFCTDVACRYWPCLEKMAAKLPEL